MAFPLPAHKNTKVKQGKPSILCSSPKKSLYDLMKQAKVLEPQRLGSEPQLPELLDLGPELNMIICKIKCVILHHKNVSSLRPSPRDLKSMPMDLSSGSAKIFINFLKIKIMESGCRIIFMLPYSTIKLFYARFLNASVSPWEFPLVCHQPYLFANTFLCDELLLLFNIVLGCQDSVGFNTPL